MSIERQERTNGNVVWRVRRRDHNARNRSKVIGRKKDAELFEAEIRGRKRTGELSAMDGGRETLDEYVTGVWRRPTRLTSGRGPARTTRRPTTDTSDRDSAG